MYKADLLSQKSLMGVKSCICNSESKDTIQVNSQQVSASDLYSASADERETICCFLHFQVIRESPSKTQKPVRESLVLGQLAQSASQYAVRARLEVEENSKPWYMVPLMYLTTFRAAVQ